MSQTDSRPVQFQPESWERWLRVWHVGFFVMLIGLSVVALAEAENIGKCLLVFTLSVLLAVWYLFGLRDERNFRERRGGRAALYFGFGWTAWFALVNLHPIYSYLLFGLYPQASMLLPARSGVAATLVLTGLWGGLDLIYGDRSISNLINVSFAGFLTCVLKLFIEAIISQNIARRLLIQKLESTRAELARAERQAGMLEERARLAREIHDTLAQGFTSIVIQIETADGLLPPGLSAVRNHLDQARRTARESLGEARRLVWALRPESLERASLDQALTRLAARWQDETCTEAEALITGQPCPLRPEVEVMLLRAAQEALTNVRKHAQAAHVRLTLSYMDDLVTLDVQDDGIGFRPTEPGTAAAGDEQGGFGLNAMRSRVEQLGGTLQVESAPGEGTTLAISLPAFRQPALAVA